MTTLVLQPDATAGKDGYIRSDGATTNYGTADTFYVGRFGAGTFRGLLQFDLSSVPAGSMCTAATLDLYMFGDSSDTDATIGIYRILCDWMEAQFTWNIAKTGTDWGTAGCDNTSSDREASPIGSRAFSATETALEVKSFSLTPSALTAMFPSGAFTNNGFICINSVESSTSRFDFRSSDRATAAQRPKLTVTYTEAPQTQTIYYPQMTRMVIIPRTNTPSPSTSKIMALSKTIQKTSSATSSLQRRLSLTKQFVENTFFYLHRLIQTSTETISNSVFFLAGASVELTKLVQYASFTLYHNASVTIAGASSMLKQVLKPSASQGSAAFDREFYLSKIRTFVAVGNNDSSSKISRRLLSAGQASVARSRKIGKTTSRAVTGSSSLVRFIKPLLQYVTTATIDITRNLKKAFSINTLITSIRPSASILLSNTVVASGLESAKKHLLIDLESISASGSTSRATVLVKSFTTAVSSAISMTRAAMLEIANDATGTANRTSNVFLRFVRDASAVLFIWTDVFRITLGQLILTLRRRQTL